jgi:uncharacterized protein YydD (DUF2326 family)
MSNFSVNFPNQAAGLDPVQNRNPSAIGPNDQDVAFFDDFMNAPAEDFQSRFEKLPEFQQQQIRESRNKYNDQLDSASAALKDVPAPPQLDANRLQESGYLDEYLKNSEAFLQKSGVAMSKTQESIDAGIAFLDTLEGIDPSLAKAPPLPEMGKELLNLMRVSGSSKQQIDRVTTAFGISQ